MISTNDLIIKFVLDFEKYQGFLLQQSAAKKLDFKLADFNYYLYSL